MNLELTVERLMETHPEMASAYLELYDDEIEIFENFISTEYPNGMADEELVDMFTESTDFLAAIVGYDDWEELIQEHKETEDEVSEWDFENWNFDSDDTI